jgi:hypothetical protein
MMADQAVDAASRESNAEEWREAAHFPDYEVSSRGRVRRITTRTSAKAGHVLRAAASKRGYFAHGLCRDGKSFNVRLNRLVCETFHGPPPTPDHEAAHADDDPSNNAAHNLSWATRLENEADKTSHGRRRRGTQVRQAKITEEAARAILAERRRGVFAKDLAERYAVSEGLIRHIEKGRAWRHATGL